MNDRELLERAAKAAGYSVEGDADKLVAFPGRFAGGFSILNELGGSSLWNPLTDDGDALRLAVRLHISVRFCWDGCDDQYDTVTAEQRRIYADEQIGFDMKATQFDEPAATRRAIVRAAAAIAEGT